MHLSTALAYLALTASCVAATRKFGSKECTSFAGSKSLSIPRDTTIQGATHYAAGAYNVSGAVNQISFCDVRASVAYGTNDTLNFALWLPDEGYSSRFMAVGNGGYSGVINDADMLFALNTGQGFAVGNGDTGHPARDGQTVGTPGVYEPFLHDDDQVKAWLHNAISIFTPAAKALIKAYYGHSPKQSYYRGCSTGGAQGFSLAQFHPGLFDGIIAGCPANWFTHVLLAFLWNGQQANKNEANFTQPILDLIQAKVIEKCDKLDGVKDNLVENPLVCDFDIDSLACAKEEDGTNETCLTAAQLAAAKAIYQGPVRSDRGHKSIFPGIAVGSEAGWALPIVASTLSNVFSVPTLQNLVYDDLSKDLSKFNWASDVDYVDKVAGPLINSIKTDLSAFRDKGGKMIVYAGWADPNISPKWALQHVSDITRDTLGRGKTIAENDFVKVVMVPGGGHCGPNIAKYPYVPGNYDFEPAIVDWVEKKREPVKGIRSWGPTNGDDRTRRLCTWPKVAKLKRGGDVDDWESYICA